MLNSNLSSRSDAADGRAVRRHDNAKRLFDAAMRLAERSGYQSISADDICSEAGVGRATFFRIYKSKAGLLRESNRRLALEIEERLEKIEGNSIEKLFVVADEIALAWQRGGAVLAAMVADFMSSSLRDTSHWVHQEIFDLVLTIVTQGMEKKELRRSLQPEQLASLIVHQINIAIAEAGMSGRKNLQPLAREVLEHFFNGAAQN